MTNYALTKKIPAADLLDGRLRKFGFTPGLFYRELIPVRLAVDEDGFVTGFNSDIDTDYFRGLSPIWEEFGAGVISEDHPRIWGHETNEEWERAKAEMETRRDDEFYQELGKHLRGEPNTINGGTDEDRMARRAKQLVKCVPDLLSPANKQALLVSIKDDKVVLIQSSDGTFTPITIDRSDEFDDEVPF